MSLWKLDAGLSAHSDSSLGQTTRIKETVRAEDSVSWKVLVRITVKVIQGTDLITFVRGALWFQRNRQSVVVSPNGKWPPTQPRSAVKTQLISSTLMLTAGRDFALEGSGFYYHHLTRNINCLRVKQYHEPERNMTCVVLPLSARKPGETQHLKPAISEKHTLCVGA